MNTTPQPIIDFFNAQPNFNDWLQKSQEAIIIDYRTGKLSAHEYKAKQAGLMRIKAMNTSAQIAVCTSYPPAKELLIFRNIKPKRSFSIKAALIKTGLWNELEYKLLISSI